MAEGPDGTIYLSDLTASGEGRIFAVSPNGTVSTIPITGLDGPDVLAVVNGYLVIANEEDLQTVLGVHVEGADVTGGTLDVAGYRKAAERVTTDFGPPMVGVRRPLATRYTSRTTSASRRNRFCLASRVFRGSRPISSERGCDDWRYAADWTISLIIRLRLQARSN